MYEHIKCTVADGIATITIDRPAANNSLNMQMFRDLIRIVEHCGAEDAVKVIVITARARISPQAATSRKWRHSSSSAMSFPC